MAQESTNGSEEAPWKTKAANKRAAEYAKIPAEWRLSPEYLTGNAESDISVIDIPAKCGILTGPEIEITEKYSALGLEKAYRSGAFTASAVATAFCKRAAIAHQLTNCLTETFFADAIKRGEELDKFVAENQRLIGPLHGIPISIKDSFNYVGVASTIGLISYLDRPLPDKNSPLVDILLSLGAILYCKTNIPQTLMSADSDNNVFGRVLNPHKLKLGAGGSSGGEGALVAMRGSILGVGTDIGGSIRIPALCCGTYGFKPSAHRIPYGGQSYCTRRGSPGFPAVAGPLATTIDDMAFFARTVIDAKPWDSDATAIPYPWRAWDADTPKTLRIGYFAADPDFPIQPPVLRAVETAVKKLLAADVEVVSLHRIPSLNIGKELANDCFSLDNSKQWLQRVQESGEPIIPSILKTMQTILKKPDGYTLGEVFDLNVSRAEYKAAWNEVWVEEKLDVILCPGAQNTAVPHDEYGVPVYTMVWNLLEYPGVIIPVGKADKSVDRDELAMPDPQRTYKADVVDGAPTAIQLIARNYHDEELIAASRVIDRILNQ